MRLTVDVIEYSASFLNAVNDMELDLRGNKIPSIENLAVTRDQHDTIDFSDNDIKRLENFPLMHRLKSIYLNNNRVMSIEPNLGKTLVNIQNLIMNNNFIQELNDLEPLFSVKTLRCLSLIGNPVTKRPNYRLFIAHNMPNIKLLDFRKINTKEREEAAKVFGGKEVKSATFIPGDGLDKYTKKRKLEEESFKNAITNAKSLEEVQQLEKAMRSGNFQAK
ncbi:U2 small nuclear ribonucleo protein A-like protein [Rozella allomycis CSF55]|uniref:U2 small nuclear ribonucleoprotein A' n=1 Tax=Rozella allomycis (strain CSF55) TaxID=988480 RepID=A0A075AP20_ROZAC|nr:hypothetical protein O9G_000234 [Rozella allomycis CSF55]RKP19242.1 U2 small nuclear ribonucleo protein A-like protein [Rozella allomycis CSF55]|eukprot:EPZ31755.1 hypothetical protein O9G_000234 [Rozella allomycis CSF55]